MFSTARGHNTDQAASKSVLYSVEEYITVNLIVVKLVHIQESNIFRNQSCDKPSYPLTRRQETIYVGTQGHNKREEVTALGVSMGNL